MTMHMLRSMSAYIVLTSASHAMESTGQRQIPQYSSGYGRPSRGRIPRYRGQQPRGRIPRYGWQQLRYCNDKEQGPCKCTLSRGQQLEGLPKEDPRAYCADDELCHLPVFDLDVSRCEKIRRVTTPTLKKCDPNSNITGQRLNTIDIVALKSKSTEMDNMSALKSQSTENNLYSFDDVCASGHSGIVEAYCSLTGTLVVRTNHCTSQYRQVEQNWNQQQQQQQQGFQANRQQQPRLRGQQGNADFNSRTGW